jgi:hypothetical protein
MGSYVCVLRDISMPKVDKLFNYYSGIGSRSTPSDVLAEMRSISEFLAKRNYILRSGGADGADTAFESGLPSGAFREIYLPWQGFNDHPSPLCNVCKHALAEAQAVHPNWKRLSAGGRKLHARNAYQVLGRDLKTPSKFIVCWTPNGEAIGGTRTAIVIAMRHGIRVCNLAVDNFEKFFSELHDNPKG